MLSKKHFEKGDTLIEVLFAITVFSMVVVSALSIMNQGTAAAQRSLEMSLVTQEVGNQAETLRFLHESYVTNYQNGYESTPGLSVPGQAGQFYKIVQSIDKTITQASPFNSPTKCPTPPTGSFILNTRTGAVVMYTPAIFKEAVPYAKLDFNTTNINILEKAGGIWIEAVKSQPNAADPSQSGTGYIDFHIRACWSPPGVENAVTLGTIVRLYEPRT